MKKYIFAFVLMFAVSSYAFEVTGDSFKAKFKIDSNFFASAAEDWSKPDESIKSFEKNPGVMSSIKTLFKSI